MHGGLAIAGGRGEKLKFFEPPRPPLTTVIAVPSGVEVSTKWAYQNYEPMVSNNKDEIFERIVQSYRRRDLEDLRKVVFNDLESVTLHRHPEVQRIKEILNSTGEGVCLMSGSGPSVFGLFADKKSAMRAVKKLHGEAVEVFIEHTTRRNS
jgi:4-diphosphocytidyl-2-C-methyl-D-erythritol kinase